MFSNFIGTDKLPQGQQQAQAQQRNSNAGGGGQRNSHGNSKADGGGTPPILPLQSRASGVSFGGKPEQDEGFSPMHKMKFDEEDLEETRRSVPQGQEDVGGMFGSNGPYGNKNNPNRKSLEMKPGNNDSRALKQYDSVLGTTIQHSNNATPSNLQQQQA